MRNTAAPRRPASALSSASLLVLAGLVSGCAGDVMRFTDGMYTSAVPVRPPEPVQTPFPGDATRPAQAAPQTAPVLAPQAAQRMGVDPTLTGSVRNVPATPAAVGRQPMAPPAQARPAPVAQAPAAQPRQIPIVHAQPAAAPAPQAPTVQQVAPQTPARGDGEAGWTATGGTYVTLRQGETLYNLTKRYGVPVDALMRVNTISDPRGVQAGQRILIPTYVHGRTAGISAPDANAGVRSARASTGGRAEVNPARLPLPAARPHGTIPAAAPAVAQAPAPAVQPAAAAPATVQGGRYTVQSGDTLSAISRRTGASIAAIKRTNGLESDMVRIGQSLIIPGLAATPASPTQVASANVDPVVTGAVENTPAPARRIDQGSVTRLETVETARAPEATGISTMRWPVRGRVVSAFGSNSGGRPNDGIDISVPVGTDVKAAENGVVIYAGDGLKEFGQTILVRHEDSVVTVYGHLSDMKVNRGDTVERGQTIAASGMSGSARQPQLHFEVRKDATPVDPTQHLN